MLSTVDAVFGGRVEGESLRRVVQTVVDFEVLFKDERARELVLSLISGPKLAELEDRLGRPVASAGEWSDADVRCLMDFFGLVEERALASAAASSGTVHPKYGLFEHQRRAVERLAPLLEQDERRAVLHLPTGVGKTRTAMYVVAETLRAYEPSVVVWLASGRELLEQAVAAFREAWTHLGSRPLRLETMWGDQTPDLDGLSDGFLAVGLAKGWSLMARTDPDWAARLAPRVRLVVFDEAHQSIARTYRRITDDLTLQYGCSLLGLTATPGRTWADIDEDGKLVSFFSGNKVPLEVPGENPIQYLIDSGYLARPRFRTLLARPGLRLAKRDLARIARSLDIPREIVAALSMSEQYVAAVVGAIEELLRTGHRRILVFAATVDHALVISGILVAKGIRSHAITGSTSARVRAHAIQSFRSADDVPTVLVNFAVLTTGFDAPKASAVVIARPTQSLVLYSQMVGRGIRGERAGGTRTCEIVTVVDPTLQGFGDVAEAFLNWENAWK